MRGCTSKSPSGFLRTRIIICYNYILSAIIIIMMLLHHIVLPLKLKFVKASTVSYLRKRKTITIPAQIAEIIRYDPAWLNKTTKLRKSHKLMTHELRNKDGNSTFCCLENVDEGNFIEPGSGGKLVITVAKWRQIHWKIDHSHYISVPSKDVRSLWFSVKISLILISTSKTFWCILKTFWLSLNYESWCFYSLNLSRSSSRFGNHREFCSSRDCVEKKSFVTNL